MESFPRIKILRLVWGIFVDHEERGNYNQTMRLVIQRVKRAYVQAGEQVVGRINLGLLIFLGIGKEDTPEDADYLIRKIIELRIFEDKEGKMNLSAKEAGAEFLVVSQFTLYGDCLKGRRPSFDAAALPQKAEGLYEYFVEQLRAKQVRVETGMFRVMMEVHLINDGPVTFVLESSRGSPLL